MMILKTHTHSLAFISDSETCHGQMEENKNHASNVRISTPETIYPIQSNPLLSVFFLKQCLGARVLSSTSFTLKMSVFSCSSVGGAECISPNKVPISSSPLGDNTNCWMIIRACCRHWGYFTMLCTHLAPPNSLKIPTQKGGGGDKRIRSMKNTISNK